MVSAGTAIIAIASFAAAIQGLYGNVKVLDGLLVGIPGMAGVLAGTWLQQRLPSKAIAYLFAVVLVATAVQLVLQ